MSESNVKQLAISANNNQMWSVSDMLSDCINRIENGEYSNKKAILILVDDDDDRFLIDYLQASMRQSEVIAACDIMKTLAKQNMGYIPYEE